MIIGLESKSACVWIPSHGRTQSIQLILRNGDRFWTTKSVTILVGPIVETCSVLWLQYNLGGCRVANALDHVLQVKINHGGRQTRIDQFDIKVEGVTLLCSACLRVVTWS